MISPSSLSLGRRSCSRCGLGLGSPCHVDCMIIQNRSLQGLGLLSFVVTLVPAIACTRHGVPRCAFPCFMSLFTPKNLVEVLDKVPVHHGAFRIVVRAEVACRTRSNCNNTEVAQQQCGHMWLNPTLVCRCTSPMEVNRLSSSSSAS
jgi:hypothetical protein